VGTLAAVGARGLGVEPLGEIARHGVCGGHHPERVAVGELFAGLGKLGQTAEECFEPRLHAALGRVESKKFVEGIERDTEIALLHELEAHLHLIDILHLTLDCLVERQAPVVAGIEPEHKAIVVCHVIISGGIECLDLKLIDLAYGVNLRKNSRNILHEHRHAGRTYLLDDTLQALRAVASLKIKCLDVILMPEGVDLIIKIAAGYL